MCKVVVVVAPSPSSSDAADSVIQPLPSSECRPTPNDGHQPYSARHGDGIQTEYRVSIIIATHRCCWSVDESTAAETDPAQTRPCQAEEHQTHSRLKREKSNTRFEMSLYHALPFLFHRVTFSLLWPFVSFPLSLSSAISFSY